MSEHCCFGSDRRRGRRDAAGEETVKNTISQHSGKIGAVGILTLLVLLLIPAVGQPLETKEPELEPTVIAEEGTRLANLKQPPLNTTMMGVLKAAADYHGLKLDEPMIYGLSGHAFLINIDPQLCPCAPYVWKTEEAMPLITNMGLKVIDLGFFGEDSRKDAREEVERRLRDALKKGIPCSLLNMEHQTIDGYDRTGFFAGHPWGPGKQVAPDRLSFGSWKEFGKEVHATFYTIEKVQPAARKTAILASLDYAIDMWKNPGKHSAEGFGVGPKAYDNWIKGVPEAGASHGNWWNGSVWSECRRMAADFFTAIGAEDKTVTATCAQLNADYLKIAFNLGKASSKTMAPDEKIDLLKETKELEASAIGKVEKLAATLRGEPAGTTGQNAGNTANGTTAMAKATRVVLPNLRVMRMGNKGQNYNINGHLEFQMECLGESKGYDYWFFGGVSGDAHTQVFSADITKCCRYLTQIDFTPEIARKWYDAVGYDFTIITEQQFNADRPRYVGELMKYIDRGIPIVAKHSTQSAADFVLLVGYEEGGGQLLFVDDSWDDVEAMTNLVKEPTNQHIGYLFILPGAKKKAPAPADVYRKAVLNIPTLLTQPKKGDLYYGRGAFEAWSDHLMAEDYAGKTDEEMDGWKLHESYVCILATNGSMRNFLDRAIKLCPDLPFLTDVAKEYAELARLWSKDLEAVGGSFNCTKATLRNKEAKRPIAEVIRRCAAVCDRIVELYRKNGYGPGAAPNRVIHEALKENVAEPATPRKADEPVQKPTLKESGLTSTSFPTDTIADPFAGREPPLLTNRIKHYRRIQPWENYFLASAICSVAEATGADEEALKTIGREKVNGGFHFFSAITGDMFTPLYASDKPCDSGVTNYVFMPQVVKKAYAAFGYDCTYLSNAQIQKDFRGTMNAIKASVDKGIPVLAWGMGHVPSRDGKRYDPWPEGCLIGGYDENDLLYINLYAGPERMTVDKDGYTAITRGLEGTKGLFFVGKPIKQPELREIYRNAIEGIPAALAKPPADGYVFGQEAFNKWADTLLEESRFAGKTNDELSAICWAVHTSPYCNVCTSAAEAYIRAAAEVHDIPCARKLLPLYQEFTRLRQEIWTLHGGFEPPMDKFRTREFRPKIATLLRRMGSVCDEILRVSD